MGTGMGTKVYLLPCGNRNETKVWYPLNLNKGVGINFFMEMDIE